MKFKVQLICVADGREQVREVACFDRHGVETATLGLALADGKALLKAIQQAVVEAQLGGYIKAQQRCPHCGQVRPIKDYHPVTFRTVFGNLPVRSPRLHHCRCRFHPTKTFSPLAERLPEHVSPELLYLETKRASLVSYGITVDLLKEVLPMRAHGAGARRGAGLVHRGLSPGLGRIADP